MRGAPKVGKRLNEGHKGQKGGVREGEVRTGAKPVGGASHHMAIYRDY